MPRYCIKTRYNKGLLLRPCYVLENGGVNKIDVTAREKEIDGNKSAIKVLNRNLGGVN
jgi:hypothetical protein